MPQCAARPQQLKIALGKTLMRVLVHRIERVHQTITKSICIDIERSMNEMRNVGPVMPIDAVETQRGTQALALHCEPDLGETVRGQLGFAPLVMYLLLEGDEGDLPNDRVQHVLDFA